MSNRHKPRAKSINTDPILDVVIPTAGRYDMLRKCMDALSKISVPINIYIIDNGSDPEEHIANQDLFELENVTSKRLPQMVGFPAACNEGARMGKAPLIMFLNDDIKLLDGAVEKIISDFSEDNIGVVGIKLLFPEDVISPIRPAGKVQHVGMCLNVRGEPIHPLVGWSKNNPKCCISRDVWAVTGACMTVRRKLFDKAGGFNSMYGVGTFEDLDMCLTVRQMGSRIRLEAEAVGYHYVGATVEKKQQAYPMQENYMKFRSKWANSGLFSWEEWTFW